MTLPLFFYNVAVFTTNPAFAQWSAQNILTSPPPLHNLLAYLPLIVLAVIGGRWLWRQSNLRIALLIGWPLIVPLLVYLPINVQRRLAEAVIVPLAILAVMGIGVLAGRWSRRWLVIVTLLVTLPTSLLLVMGGYAVPLARSPQAFYPAEQVAALNWLNQHAQPDEVVFAAKNTGNQVPAYTHLRVYVGHGPETLYGLDKERLTEQFYGGALSADERMTLYADMRIRYVFYGPYEREFSRDIRSNWLDELTQIYAENGIEIYEVP